MTSELPPSPSASSPIGSLPLRRPVRVAPTTSLQDAAATMRREEISSLVVDTNPASFVTERDLVRAMADGRALSDPVGAVAARAPICVPPTVTVAHAAALMVGLGIRHLLVLASTGEVAGVLSIRDAFELLLRALDPDGWVSTFASALGDVERVEGQARPA